MAGETSSKTPEGNGNADKLDRVIDLLTGIQATLDQGADLLKRYGPALDKAARLVDSPAARVAAKIPGGFPRARRP